MKRFLKKGICYLMIAAVLTANIMYAPAAEKSVMAAEEEVPEGYTAIHSADELYAIRNDLEGKYMLMNDIDLSGDEWSPIDNFRGTLDGNGYRIKGMTITGEVKSTCLGLIGSAEYPARIENLGLLDVVIDATINSEDWGWNDEFYCGSIVGNGNGDTAIENCFVTGSISIAQGATSAVGYVGGIAGYDCDPITNCYNTADIAINNDSNERIWCGGILGAASFVFNIDCCYNRGMINEGKGRAIIGKYNSGYIHEVKNCVYLKGSGEDKTDSTPLSDTQMKNANYFSNFDFKDAWEVDADSLYTYPQLKSCMQVRIKDLALEQEPTKTEYNQGDKLSVAGGKIAITYEDDRSSTASITDAMVSGYDMSKIGTQDVTVRKGNLTVTYSITVKAVPVTRVNLNKTTLSMNRGDETMLTASVAPSNATDKDITWSSDNSRIVTVDQKGKVKAVANGSAKVTATASNGIKATCQITVIVPCESIDFDESKLTIIDEDEEERALVIDEGSKVALPYTKYPASSTEKITWEIKDRNIATIDATDTLTALQSGVTTITGKTASGTRNTLTVIVTEDISGFHVDGIQDKDYTGNEITQNVVVTDGARILQEGIDYSVSYSPNTEPGTVTLTISGNLPYKGTITREFQILPVVVPTPEPEPTPTVTPPEDEEDDDEEEIKVGKASIASVKASKKKLTIQWKKVSNASGYQIQVALNKKFTKGKKTYRVSKSTLKKIFKGKAKTTYYVRVRAYAYDSWGDRVYGKYSAVKKKKTK